MKERKPTVDAAIGEVFIGTRRKIHGQSLKLTSRNQACSNEQR